MHYIVIIASEDVELLTKLTSAVKAGLESVEVIGATGLEEALRRYKDLISRNLQPSSVVIDSQLEDSGFLYSALLDDRVEGLYGGSIVSCNSYPEWVDRYMDELFEDVELDIRYPWLLPLHIRSKDMADSMENL
ncbi:hypothetical protein HY312_03300 [Candidatus Saccharibacteria bacterium]|nr:hypothetical protein [Candidatus Saccharibacteria bacterium]